MLTPASRAQRTTVQHHPDVPPIRPGGAEAIPFSVRLSWAAQALTAAYGHRLAGDLVAAWSCERIASTHLAALRAHSRPGPSHDGADA